jgi:hypothetical protein
MGADTSERERDLLIDEIRRYLAVVDVFRGEGCLPAWQREPSPSPVGPGLEPQTTLN